MSIMFAIACATPNGTRFFGPFRTANQAAVYADRSLTNAWSIISMTAERERTLRLEPAHNGRRKRRNKRHARS